MAEQTPAHPARATAWALRVMALLLAVVALSQLAACGGGGDDPEPDKTIDPLVCLHRPEVCK